MRIGLNATCFNGRPSGATQRFRGIYGAFIRQNPQYEFLVYEPADYRVGKWFADAPNVTIRATPMPSIGGVRRWLTGKFYWAKAFRDDKLDVFEHFTLPLVHAPDCPTLFTIHDVRSQELAGYPIWQKWLYRAILRHALSNADQVLAVSDTMLSELQAICPGTRVTRLYNGIDAEVFGGSFCDKERAKLMARFKLTQPFYLTVGHIEKRKNYLSLIKALRILRDRGDPRGLVIVGNDSGHRAALDELIQREGLQNQVSLFSGVNDLDLVLLYRACDAFIFPSTYEGFGIPILEAMAAERVLISSDLPVFREITENKGAYFPAREPAAMAETIETVMNTPEKQAQLLQYGKTRIDDFSFELLARQLGTIYQALLSPGNHASG